MFYVVRRGQFLPAEGAGAVYLNVDHWNDYSFITMFGMSVHDEGGVLHEIGQIKIGFFGQTAADATYLHLPEAFQSLTAEFFALGQSVDFYKRLAALSPRFRQAILDGLRDIVADPSIISAVKDEKVFGISLLREVSLSEVRGQFARVLEGKAELTNFSFSFVRPATDRVGGVEIGFNVSALSAPSTNIHAVIGRNGVGKTTLLNGMIKAITDPSFEGKFLEWNAWGSAPISSDYFSSLVSVSFSAFDPFEPPADQPDPSKGACYFYIGLKRQGGGTHRSIEEIQQDCARYLVDCFSSESGYRRWVGAIERLGSDENFASMGLVRLKDVYDQVKAQSGAQSDSLAFRQIYFDSVRGYLCRMSSGHAIVLLTVTYLVATVREKTLVLLDEPESHLHPPLLSAFIRALSDLLHDRNGVAIVATHSPVILQEIPRSCVWKVARTGLSLTVRRPDIETFGENLGLLTSEVFSLEVERSGFHALLAEDVRAGGSFDEVLGKYQGQLGLEGRSILLALIASRDAAVKDDSPR